MSQRPEPEIGSRIEADGQTWERLGMSQSDRWACLTEALPARSWEALAPLHLGTLFDTMDPEEVAGASMVLHYLRGQLRGALSVSDRTAAVGLKTALTMVQQALSESRIAN